MLFIFVFAFAFRRRYIRRRILHAQVLPPPTTMIPYQQYNQTSLIGNQPNVSTRFNVQTGFPQVEFGGYPTPYQPYPISYNIL